MNGQDGRDVDSRDRRTRLSDQDAGPDVFSGSVTAPSVLVNRTHRVVRQRAKAIRSRRSYVRSLLFPLLLCSATLIVCVLAVWTGVYKEGGATDAVEDISATIGMDDEFVLMFLWFVPVTLAVLAAVWFRRMRNGSEGGIGR